MSKAARDPLALKFKGSNKAFAPFAAVSEGASVARLWAVSARVAEHLEEGERVANLSWRLWHLHSQTVIDDSPRHRREFKRLSKAVGERLDRDKGKAVRELELPDVPAYNRVDAAERLASRVKQKSRTRRPPRPDGSAASMMHTFELDPTVGIPKTSRSGSTTSVGSSSMRPTPSSDHSSGRAGSVPTPPGRDVEMTYDPRLAAPPTQGNPSSYAASSSGGSQAAALPLPPSLQRAPSIPSSLRMTPNSSRRSSFARPPAEDDNLPPPYPSNHPFARQHSGQITPLQQGLPQDTFNAQLLQAMALQVQQQQQQQGFQPNLSQQQFQALDPMQDPQQVATATLNQLWSQLGNGGGVPQNHDMFSSPFANADPSPAGAPPDSTPASSSDVSSPEHAYSPAPAAPGTNPPTHFHFAQRVTGLQGPPQAGLGGGGAPSGGSAQVGPYRRPSNGEGIGAQPFRRPSLSQQSSTLASGAGSPASTAASPYPGRTRLNSIDSTAPNRRGSFVKRRRESMNHTVGGSSAPTADSSASAQLAPGGGLAVNTSWNAAGTPTGELATGLLGVNIGSPLAYEDPSRLARLGPPASTTPSQSQQLKTRSYSSSSQGRSGLSSAALTPQMKTLNAAHLSASAQPNPLLQWQDPSIQTSTTSSVFFEDAPMEDVAQQQQQRRRSSDSNVAANRSNNSLRDQLREMQLQHQSYQQAASYASTLEAYVPPPTSGQQQQQQQRPSPSGRASFHSPASAHSPAPHVQPSPALSANESVFPSLGLPTTPAPSATLIGGGTHLQTHNPYLEPSPSFNPADFSFSQPPSLDEIGSLFNEFLAPPDPNLPSGGTPLKPVTESDADP